MQEVFKELEKPSDILVIGNGFDLHCGLKSSFKNFFDSELRLGNGRLNENRIIGNIWYLIFTFAFMLGADRGGKLVPFVNNSNPLWMDVESYIDKVFKTKHLVGELGIYDFINNKMKYEPSPEEMVFNYNTYINGDYVNQPYHIGHRVNELRGSFKRPEDLLIYELNNFEKDFADYLKKEIDKNRETYERNLSSFILNKLDNHGANEFFVLSFNYSSNFDESIKKENVLNVHGTLKNNNIIIGIGDYEEGGLPGRDLFKKVKRRVQYGYGQMRLPEKESIKSIIFYGCSFSKQDWSYYKLLFKNYGLEKKNIVFRFLYSDYRDNENDNNIERRKYRQNCTNIVNSYLQEKKSEYNFEDLYNLGYIEFSAIN